mmetsp:Transcript_17407/g.34999  ORF Transcript_17407/g.34999 Transcript_17407/m.34999 type:complete len:94 (+) Transcript_17407:741-1022(+)
MKLIQAFIQERCHGSIAGDVQCQQGKPIDKRLRFLARKLRMANADNALNPYVKVMLEKAGFVFNFVLWIADRTVRMMEAYVLDGGDINRMPDK